jgi:putative membrane protein
MEASRPREERNRDELRAAPPGEPRPSTLSTLRESERRLDSTRRKWREVAVLLGLLVLAMALSGISPKDRPTWLLEEAPVFIGVPILIATRRRFPLTLLAYRLIFVHALLLIVGGHYTFSEVPFGVWLRDALGLARNHYDRVVHFIGGFAPAVVGREILRRKTPLRPGGWLFFLVSLGCLGGSAFYELLEWWAAALTGAQASAFLATQGDVWDTQWDMLLGLVGAVAGQLVLAGRHERELAAL